MFPVLKYLVHSESFFVHGKSNRYGSSLLSVDIEFSQEHLSKTLPFITVYTFSLLSDYWMDIALWVYCGIFNVVLLIYMFIFVSSLCCSCYYVYLI